MQAFSNLSIFWKLIILLVLVIIVYYIYNKSKTKIIQLTQSGEIVLLPGELKNISQDRQNYIKGLGSDLYNDIESTSITGHDYEPYTSALQLTDNELAFLADYYKTFLTNGSESLYSAIDSNYYITGDENTKLMTRLAKIGKR